MVDPPPAGTPRAGALLSQRPRAFVALFVVSGAAGLVYEIVWQKVLGHLFGVSAFAVGAVLVAYMGGMGLGATIAGRIASRLRRPVAAFAAVELAIAAYALAFPSILAAAEAAFARFAPDAAVTSWTGGGLRLALSLLLLLPPTAAMGATLPFLCEGLLGERDLASGFAWLYGLNTLGAAGGCLLAGFVAIPFLGLTGTTRVAAGADVLVAVAARTILARARAERPPTAGPPPVPDAVDGAFSTEPSWWPEACAAVGGFVALALEVVWFRVLVLVFGSTVYSFSLMLAVFLAGLAGGAFLGGRVASWSRRPLGALAVAQTCAAAIALGTGLAVNRMPAFFLSTLRLLGTDYAGITLAKLVLSIVLLAPLALALGLVLPLVMGLARSKRGVGARVGRIYAANTGGAIAGALLAAFVALPSLGAERTHAIAVGILVLVAFGSLLAAPGPIALRHAAPPAIGLLVVGTVAVFAPSWDRRLLGSGIYVEPGRYFAPSGEIVLDRVVSDNTLMTYTEGYNDTIISFRSPDGKFITVNGSTTASDHLDDMVVQRLLGHLPAAFHPGPIRRACVVGLGVGVTAGSVALHDVDRITVVELERGVREACRFFSPENHDLLDSPKLDLRIDDARSFLKTTRERFDLISSEPNFPSLSGAASLYATDFLRICRSRLAPNGIMCHWSPLWRLRTVDVRRIVGSFAEVFPHVRVFSAGIGIVILGRVEPFPPVDAKELTSRLAPPTIAESLAGAKIKDALDLLALYRFDEGEVARFVGGVAPTTDDRPVLEFSAPRSLFDATIGPNLAALAEVTPPPEVRAARLGLEEPWRGRYLAAARRYDDVVTGEILLSQGKSQSAFEHLVPAADAGQGYAAYVVASQAEAQGLALQSKGDLATARLQFVTALAYQPGRFESLVGLGWADLFLGGLDEADENLSEAARLFPNSAAARFRLAAVREVRKQPEDAERLCREAIALQPELSETYALLGKLVRDKGDTAGALALFDEAFRRGERTEGVYLGRAEALLSLGRPVQAQEAAREGAARFPSSADVAALWVKCASASGDPGALREATARRDALPARSAPPGPTSDSPGSAPDPPGQR